MPPRKKATTNTPATASTRITRSSSRTKPTPVSTTSTKPPSKAAKRVHASSDSEEEKPAAKKLKTKAKTKAKAKAKADEDDAEEADQDVVDDEPPKKMVHLFYHYCKPFSHEAQVTIVKRGAAAVDPMSSFVGKTRVKFILLYQTDLVSTT